MRFVFISLLLAGCAGKAPPPQQKTSAPPPPPVDVAASFAACKKAHGEGRLDDARTECERAGAHAPESGELAADISLELAHVALALDLTDEGLRHLAASVQQHPRAEPYFMTGAILLERFQFGSACDAWTAGLKLNPRHAVAQAQLAACRMADGDPRGAKEEYDLCRRLSEEPCTCEPPIANAAIQTSLYDGASRYVKTMQTDCPDNVLTHRLQCEIDIATERCKEAKQGCKRAREIAPDDPAVKESLAKAKSCGS